MISARSQVSAGQAATARSKAFRPFTRQRVRLQAAAGPAATEVAAVAAYKAATPNGEGLDQCIKLLQQAAADKSVKPELVEGALAYLEQSHAKPAASVDGTWRLVFSTATSSRMMQYIPVQEDFVIQLQQQYCALESVVGPFRFIISGSIKGWQPDQGALNFQFTAVDILLFDNKIWRVNPTTKPKTYTFFYDNGTIAAARSSAGGLALLRR